MARARSIDGSFALLQQSKFLVVQCFDQHLGTFADGNDCLIREIQMLTTDVYWVIESTFQVDPGSGVYDLGFILFLSSDQTKFDNRTAQAGESQIVVAKLRNLQSVHLVDSILVQNTALTVSTTTVNSQCAWGSLARRVVMMAYDAEDALIVCSSTDFASTSLNGGSQAVALEKLDVNSAVDSATD